MSACWKPPLAKFHNDQKARGCVNCCMFGCRIRSLGSYVPGGRVPSNYVLFWFCTRATKFLLGKPIIKEVEVTGFSSCSIQQSSCYTSTEPGLGFSELSILWVRTRVLYSIHCCCVWKYVATAFWSTSDHRKLHYIVRSVKNFSLKNISLPDTNKSLALSNFRPRRGLASWDWNQAFILLLYAVDTTAILLLYATTKPTHSPCG